MVEKELLLRAHHFYRLGPLTKNANWFESNHAPKKIENIAEFSVNHLISNIKFYQTAQYCEDVLGHHLSSEQLFKYFTKQFYISFMTYPNEFPVRVLVNSPDVICRNCVIGEHCLSDQGDSRDFMDLQRRFKEKGVDIKPGEVVNLGLVRQIVSDIFLERYPALKF